MRLSGRLRNKSLKWPEDSLKSLQPFKHLIFSELSQRATILRTTMQLVSKNLFQPKLKKRKEAKIIKAREKRHLQKKLIQMEVKHHRRGLVVKLQHLKRNLASRRLIKMMHSYLEHSKIIQRHTLLTQSQPSVLKWVVWASISVEVQKLKSLNEKRSSS